MGGFYTQMRGLNTENRELFYVKTNEGVFYATRCSHVCGQKVVHLNEIFHKARSMEEKNIPRTFKCSINSLVSKLIEAVSPTKGKWWS